ncbi:MAG: hypothetical protein R6X15_03815 [Pseudomonadota bacterium]
MNRRFLWTLAETIFLVSMGSFWRAALSATAIATVTVNIVEPSKGSDGLSLSVRELHLQEKTHDEFTIMNRSDYRRELLVELAAPSGNSADCNLRFSPRTTSIPSGGHQVVRLMIQDKPDGACRLENELLISDAREPGVPLFNVPVYSEQAYVGENNQNYE